MKEAVRTETSPGPPPVSPPVPKPAAEPAPAPPAPPPPSPQPSTVPAPPGAVDGKGKTKSRGITFKGICIFCGERFTVSEEEMGDRSFGFCNSLCRMKFDMDLSEDID